MQGDLESFNKTLAGGRKVQTDYELQIGSLGNQMAIFKNNLDSVNVGLLDMARTYMGIVNNIFPKLTKGLREVDSDIKSVSNVGTVATDVFLGLAGTMTAIGIAGQALNFMGITKALKDIKSLSLGLGATVGILGKINLVALTLSTIMGIVVAIAGHQERIKKAEEDISKRRERDLAILEEHNNALQKIKMSILGLNAEISAFINTDISDAFSDTYKYIDRDYESLDRYKELLFQVSKIYNQMEFKPLVDLSPTVKNINATNANNPPKIKSFSEITKDSYIDDVRKEINSNLWNKTDDKSLEGMKRLIELGEKDLKVRKKITEEISASNKASAMSATWLEKFFSAKDISKGVNDYQYDSAKALAVIEEQSQKNRELSMAEQIKDANFAQIQYEQLAITIRDISKAYEEMTNTIKTEKFSAQKSLFNELLSQSKTIEEFISKTSKYSKVGMNTAGLDSFKDLTKGLTDLSSERLFDAFKTPTIQNLVSQFQTLTEAVNIGEEAIKKNKKTVEEAQKTLDAKYKGVTSVSQLTNDKEATEWSTLKAITSSAEKEATLLQTQKETLDIVKINIVETTKGLALEKEKTKEYEIQKALLTDIYRETVQSYKEFQYQGNIKLFDIKEEGIIESFKRKREEYNFQINALGDINKLTNEQAQAEINKAGKITTNETESKRIKDLQTMLDLREQIKASYVEEIQSNEILYKEQRDFVSNYQSIVTDILAVEGNRLDILNRTLKDLEMTYVSEKNILGTLERQLKIYKAKKDIREEENRIDKEGKGLWAEYLGLQGDSVVQYEYSLSLAYQELQASRGTTEEKNKQLKYDIEKWKYEKAIVDEKNNALKLSYERGDIGLDSLSIQIRELEMLGKIDDSKMSENEKEELRIQKLKIQNELLQGQLGTILSTVDAMTKGSQLSPSFDMGKITGGLSRWMKGKNASPQQVGEMANFMLTQFNNIYQRVNQAEVQKINRDIEMLEARKSLAKTDEERLAIESDILNRRIEAIRLEAKGQATQNIMGGITGGISSGIQAGVATGNPYVAVAVGAMNVLGGILGANSAEKQSKIQEKQLREQEKIRLEAERQTKLLENQKKFYQDWLKYSFSGVSYGMNKSISITPFKTTKDKYSSMAQYNARGKKEYKTDYTTLNYEIKSYDDFIEKLTELKKQKSDLEKTKPYDGKWEILHGESLQKALVYNKNIEEYNKTIKAFEDKDKEYLSQKKIIYSNYFDWDLQQNETTGLYYKEAWKKREDIMNQVVENAKTGANNIAYYMGDYVTSSIISAWTRNRKDLNTILSDVEENVSWLSGYMAEHINDNLTEMFSPNEYEDGFGMVNSYLRRLTRDFTELSEEQSKINTQASEFIKIWVSNGGKISDITSMMSDMQKGLYSTFLSAVQSEDMLSGAQDLGNYFGEQIGKSMAESIMNNQLKNSFTSISQLMTNAIDNIGQTGIINFNVVSQTAQEIRKSMAEVELQRQQLQVATDLLTYQGGDYTSANQQINYETGSTKNNVYNTYNNVAFEIGNAVASDSAMRELADELIGYLDESSRNSSLKF